VALSRIAPNELRLRRRLVLAKNFRLVSGSIAAVTGISVLAQVLAHYTGLAAVLSAVVTTVATLCGLWASHLEMPLYGGSGSLPDMLEQLIDTRVRAGPQVADLETWRDSDRPPQDASNLVSKPTSFLCGYCRSRPAYGSVHPYRQAAAWRAN